MVKRCKSNFRARLLLGLFAGLAVAKGRGILCLFTLMFLGGISCRPPAPPLRIMSYNIHHCEGTDGRIDIERIAKVITGSGADIVALQEVDRGVLRSGQKDQLLELSRLTGFHHVFGKNIAFQGGNYGLGILSRYPIVQKEHQLLPRVGPSEQRGLLAALVALDRGHKIWILNTHLDHRPDPAERLLGVKVVREFVARHPGAPILLCGDLNATPDSGVLKELLEDFDDDWEKSGVGSGYTIAAERPYERIDYVLVGKGRGWKATKAWVVTEARGSDHLPVVVEGR